MTALTQNLPWFVKDLGVSIIGQKCYTSLVENLNISNMECLKYALSKGLGIGIVVGGSIMKVPQILLIVNARSARGLSLPAYILETLSYAITLAYSFRHQFPFSTYGENLFLTLQNILITFLIIAYAPPRRGQSQRTTFKLVTTAITTGNLSFALWATSTRALAVLQMATLPLSLFSKLPQIRQNWRAQSTGQLSAIAVVSQIAGCLARLFTTATEVGDSLVAAGFALALLLNLVLGAQLYLYWGRNEQEEEEEAGFGLKEGLQYSGKGGEDQPQPLSYPSTHTPQQQQHRVATPPPRTTSSAAGKKWARKVD